MTMADKRVAFIFPMKTNGSESKRAFATLFESTAVWNSVHKKNHYNRGDISYGRLVFAIIPDFFLYDLRKEY